MAKKASAAEILAMAAAKGLQEKKGVDIVVMDLRNLDVRMADFFVVCHGTSDKHVEALSGSVEEEVRKLTGEKPWHVEGLAKSEWVLMDYVNVVVHIFLGDKREYYGLEDLWGDAQIKKIDTPV